MKHTYILLLVVGCFVAVLLGGTSDALACRCSHIASFVESSIRSSIVVHAKVTKKYKGDKGNVTVFTIQEVLKGDVKSHKTFEHIDGGTSCSDRLYGMEVGKEILALLPKPTGKQPITVSYGGCSKGWTDFTNGTAQMSLTTVQIKGLLNSTSKP